MSGSFSQVMTLLVVIAFITTITINTVYHSAGYHDLHRENTAVKQLLKAYQKKNAGKPTKFGGATKTISGGGKNPSSLLDCTAFGGPSNEFVQKEMVYWEDTSIDSKYVSPFKKTNGEVQYLTFEPDHGGWNNIRMAMETVIVFAHAMGRTIVLPPEANMYLLSNGLDFHDFFHLEAMAAKHDGINIISMEEFLKQEGLTAKLKHTQTGKVIFPPENNKTKWDNENLNPLWEYLRQVGVVPDWNLDTCLPAFSENSDPAGLKRLKKIMDEIKAMPKMPKPVDYKGKPIPVDSPPIERLKESLADRKDVCLYDESLQNSKLIHFKVDHKDSSRLLIHFYSVMFFEDWRQDLFYKRFVRDNIRYTDQLICTAAKLVEAIRERARARDPVNNPNGEFDALHVRRGDFQYKLTRVKAEVIYDVSKKKLKKNGTLYIATDERDKTFFKVFTENKFDVCYLDDFEHLYKGLDKHFMGMLDQLVVYKSRVFVGTWWSTFSGYINRLKGYFITKYELEGYENGTMKSWYFAPEERIDEMQYYWPSRPPYYMREFPTAWRDIDKAYMY